MKAVFFNSNRRYFGVAGALCVMVTFLFLSSCFTLSNQSPCDCAVNNAAASTPAYNKELGEKCDEHENSLSESERAEWQRELSACMAGK
ncbi:MAG: hypothetical protein P4L41_01650 [Flavipsychrobacter sp.]|nr:hypothetical protein [Flavipsychrobacter sp.]